MSKQDRKKATEKFEESEFVFGSKITFEEAFPSIDDLKVIVTEAGKTKSRSPETRKYTKPIGEYIDCTNPLCNGGGFSIANIIKGMVKDKETHCETTEVCKGSEGSPKGVKIYGPCMNSFQVKVEVKYKREE